MNTPYVFKKCSKCGRWLVASKVNFHKDKSKKYGLRADCKECNIARYKNYRKENKEKIAKREKIYCEEHKEEKREYRKKYYKEHKEEIAEYHKKYNEEHKEERKNWYKEHKEEKREYSKKYNKKYNKTPQGQVAIFNGRNKRRQREEQQGNGITKEQWLKMMEFFDWKCAYSGKSVSGERNRSIDHIIPITKGGAHEIWNCVPMDRSLNSSKHTKDLEEWYTQQDFYNENRLNKINEWRKYAYNKWGKEVNTKTI